MVCQMQIIKNNPKKNFEKIKDYFILAEKNNCDFISFPEYCDGFFCVENFVIGKNERFVKSMQFASKKHNVNAIFATLRFHGDVFLNTAFFINNKGKLQGSYDKISLVKYSEQGKLRKGRAIKCFETEFGKIGMLVCRDILYPQISAELSKKDAKILFCPSYWSYDSSSYSSNKTLLENFPPAADIETINTITKARAIENEIFFVFSNAAGVNKGRGWFEHLAGNSQICAPLHGSLAKFNHAYEGYIIHELDFNILEDSKETFSINR